MQFINIVVHSVENMNFRVHLQYEFTHLALDKYLEVSVHFKKKLRCQHKPGFCFTLSTTDTVSGSLVNIMEHLEPAGIFLSSW